MMIKRMTMLAFALGFVTLSAADYTDLTWYKDPIRQTLDTKEYINCAAVSPSGNVVALGTTNGVVVRRLNDANGRIRDVVQFLALGKTTAVAFTPGGNYIIAAGDDWVKIVLRREWTVRTVAIPRLDGAKDLAALSQRSEVYAQSFNKAIFEAIDFETGLLLADHQAGDSDVWQGAGIEASPDGTRLYLLWYDSPNYEGLLQAYTNPPSGRTRLWNFSVDYALAMCVGPDPDHLLVPAFSFFRGLSVIRGSDGSLVGQYDVLGDMRPAGIANSADGRFIIMVDCGLKVLRTISGADVRGLMDPNFVIAEEDVRAHQFNLEYRPLGVCLHPTLNVAYVWCDIDKKVYVIRIGLPGV